MEKHFTNFIDYIFKSNGYHVFPGFGMKGCDAPTKRLC